ncbi:MAG TPA: STAS domain-containing protein [Polyangiaceae bacterium]|nr:STAS domain-containing protein [Polyangiaceae bacterium]
MQEQITRISLQATIDAVAALELAITARDWVALGCDLELECSALERIDAMALQVLLSLQKELATTNHTLRLSSVPSEVMQYLAYAGAAESLLGAGVKS